MNITKKEIKAAFIEWKRQAKESPDDFMTEEEQVVAGPELCAEYSMEFLVKLIKEARKT